MGNTAPFSQNREKSGFSAVGIDWLTVRQTHAVPCLRHGDKRLLWFDMESGELVSDGVTKVAHRGSHSTILMIRSDGQTVEVDGNPSKFDREHNITMVPSVSAGIEVFNSVLRLLNLPEFTVGEYLRGKTSNLVGGQKVKRGDREIDDAVVSFTGCRIARVDLCRSFSAGNHSDAGRWIASQASVIHRGKAGELKGDGNAVLWAYGSRHVSFKYYLKGPELKRSGNRFAEIVKQCGIIRHEITLRQLWLKKRALEYPGAWAENDMAEIFELYPGKRVGLNDDGLAGVRDTLLNTVDPETGDLFTPGVSGKLQALVYAWAAGADLRATLSKSGFYRERRRLAAAGLDIGQPMNVQTMPTKVRTITLQQGLPEHLLSALQAA